MIENDRYGGISDPLLNSLFVYTSVQNNKRYTGKKTTMIMMHTIPEWLVGIKKTYHIISQSKDTIK